MKKHTVIDRACLPKSLPITSGIAFWLLLEHIKAPDWAYGVYWTILSILVICVVMLVFTSTSKKLPGYGEHE